MLNSEVNLKPKTLVIDEIELLECNLPEIKIRVVCSKGTYIRALARDIGVALHSGAHLIALERTRVGDVTLDQCMNPEDIDAFLDREIPADSEDKGAAQLMGINVNTTISITFAIGSALAAIAGGLTAGILFS